MFRSATTSTATSTRRRSDADGAGPGARAQSARLEARRTARPQFGESVPRRVARRAARAVLQRHPVPLRIPLARPAGETRWLGIRAAARDRACARHSATAAASDRPPHQKEQRLIAPRRLVVLLVFGA